MPSFSCHCSCKFCRVPAGRHCYAAGLCSAPRAVPVAAVAGPGVPAGPGPGAPAGDDARPRPSELGPPPHGDGTSASDDDAAEVEVGTVDLPAAEGVPTLVAPSPRRHDDGATVHG